MAEITISKDKSKLDIDLIHNFLEDAYWSKGRSKAKVIQSIENSICYGVYVENRQIGFARVATDKTIFAYIMDVFIIPEFRGNGYGKAIVDSIMNDAELLDVERWLLATADAHELYKSFGFQPIKDPSKLLGKINL